MLTIIICLVGQHYRRAFDGIRYWSKVHGITKLYLLYSEIGAETGSNLFAYMSKVNAEELREKLEILDPIMVPYNPVDQRSVFRTVYGIMNQAREAGEEALIDITSTTDTATGITLTIALMFRNARVYSVPNAEPGWYVNGEPGTPEFDKWFRRAREQPSKDPMEIQLPGYRLEPGSKHEEKEWAREQPSRDPMEIQLPGYRLEPGSKHEEKEWARESKLMVLLRENGGEAESISDIIRWFGYKTANSTLRNRFSRIVARLEMKGLVDAEKGSKMKMISLTEFGKIFAEALAEGAV